MHINEVKSFCSSLPAAEEREKRHLKNFLSYTVCGKKFAYFKTSEPEKWSFNFRVSPERFLELTDQPDIKPSWYMGRFHWITLANVELMSEEHLKELISWSYQKALSSLSKKLQAEVNA